MAITLDVSGDYAIWDNTESVTFRRKTAPNTYSDYTVTSALGRAPNWKELTASGGVYTGQDKVYNLPAATVTTSGLTVSPKMGDKIVDAIGDVWTVLSVSLNTFKQVWRLMCRNLSLAYGLRDTITIERAAITRDAAGSHVHTWTEAYAGVQARVQLVTQSPIELLGVNGAKGDYLVIIDGDVDRTITGLDRVKWGTVYLEVKELRNPQRIDELPVLDCLRIP